MNEILQRIPWSELIIEVTRSRGAGGQNVNRTNSAVIIRFNPLVSAAFSDAEKEKIKRRLSHKLTDAGELIVRSEESRDQLQNKKLAFAKLAKILQSAFEERKKRVATKPTRSSLRKRVETKRIHAETKTHRKKIKNFQFED